MRVVVAGLYASGPGYPNGAVTVDLLRNELGIAVVECGEAMPSDRHLWLITRMRPAQRIAAAWSILCRNLVSLFRVLRSADRRWDIVYVRYPAMPFMLLMSLLPSRFRPRCYVDSFISIWDSMFNDRTRSTRGVGSRLLHWLEARSLKSATKVLVDTSANAEFIRNEFRLPKENVVTFPLGVDERGWKYQIPTRAPDGKFIVTFVGTFVPLHGFGVISSAVDQFGSDDRMRFVFVGDGQDAAVLDALIQRRPDLDIVWHRGWYSPDDIATFVSQADVCLGVFGGRGKPARVLPYKLYLYYAQGKPVITQAALSTPDTSVVPPGIFIEDDSPTELAAAIRRLSVNAELRDELSVAGRDYYNRFLSNSVLTAAWRRLLEERAH